MEPIGWIALITLLFGGYHLSSDDDTKVVYEEVMQVEEKQQLVSETPVFERGKYFQSGQGYYVSNLSPVKKKIEGCDSPILTTDLSVSRKQGELMPIDIVLIQCEE